MAKYKVLRAMNGFALKEGQIVEGEPIYLETGKESTSAFLQHNALVQGDKHFTYFSGVIYDFEKVE